jgi:CheY-like chemotaxis protein
MVNDTSLGRVVLVSPDSDWRFILATMLRHVGIEVEELGDPDQIQEHAQDVALVVTNYPVRLSDGRTVTECIRATPATAHLPILNATTHVLSQELDAAERAGVSQSLSLPVTMQELANAVIAMLHSPAVEQNQRKMAERARHSALRR